MRTRLRTEALVFVATAISFVVASVLGFVAVCYVVFGRLPT